MVMFVEAHGPPSSRSCKVTTVCPEGNDENEPSICPQEIVGEGVRFGVWIDGALMREPDLAVARDLRKLGARVMLIGQKLPDDAGDLVFQLPAIPAEWQFLIDIIPAQLAAERLARLSGVDCDSFRLSSYIVEDQGGLLPQEAGKNEQERSQRTRKRGPRV